MSNVFVETEDPRVARDVSSKALVSTDAVELQKHRARRASTKRVVQSTASLEARMDSLEAALNTIIQKLSGK